jgi:PPK2 family polyphosphate:nucleotide phosphotransferase
MTDAAALDPDSFRFDPEAGHLDQLDTTRTGPFADEDDAEEATEAGAKRLAQLLLMLEAHGTHGMLVVVQGMDAAGKDEAIHHVMAAADPESAQATSFPAPTEREAPHDYLWRAAQAAPARGQLAIFNRSYYEQVVADRVHPENLDDQHLPAAVRARADDGSLWAERHRQIRDYERYLTENGIEVVKLFFHVSKDTQRERLIERIERPEKRWDFDMVDVTERAHWDDYMTAYEDAFRATSTEAAPWYVLPADHKWFARAAAAAVVNARLATLHTDFPEPGADEQATLDEARQRLEDKDD